MSLLRRKAFKFALVGTVNTAVDFTIFSLAHFLFGLPIVAANITSWVIAVTGSYVMNSHFTFVAESGGQLRAKDFGKFVVSQVAGLIANTAAVYVASFYFPVLVSKVIAIGVTFLVNFTLTHFVVFRPQPEPKPDDAQ